jgi:hypothetical protein
VRRERGGRFKPDLRKRGRSTARLALCQRAAAALGGLDFFNDHIRHEFRVVRRGRLILTVCASWRWLEVNSARRWR